jgi:hypothetical protein
MLSDLGLDTNHVAGHRLAGELTCLMEERGSPDTSGLNIAY